MTGIRILSAIALSAAVLSGCSKKADGILYVSGVSRLKLTVDSGGEVKGISSFNKSGADLAGTVNWKGQSLEDVLDGLLPAMEAEDPETLTIDVYSEDRDREAELVDSLVARYQEEDTEIPVTVGRVSDLDALEETLSPLPKEGEESVSAETETESEEETAALEESSSEEESETEEESSSEEESEEETEEESVPETEAPSSAAASQNTESRRRSNRSSETTAAPTTAPETEAPTTAAPTEAPTTAAPTEAPETEAATAAETSSTEEYMDLPPATAAEEETTAASRTERELSPAVRETEEEAETVSAPQLVGGDNEQIGPGW